MSFQTLPAPTLAQIAAAMAGFWGQQADMATQRNIWKPSVLRQLQQGEIRWGDAIVNAVFMGVTNPQQMTEDALAAHLSKVEPTDHQFISVAPDREVLVAVLYDKGNYVYPVEDMDIVEFEAEMSAQGIHIMGLAYALHGSMRYLINGQEGDWDDCYFVQSMHGEVVRRSVHPNLGKAS